MRYFILFFCLLFGQIAPIQANYSAPQTVNYQVIATDIANPIEPIQPKKSKKARLQLDEDWVWFALIFCFSIFTAGLILFPIAFGLGILWFWLTVVGVESLGLLLAVSLLFADFGVGFKALGGGLLIVVVIALSLLFLVIKGIELLIIGLSIASLAMWITGIFLIVAPIILVTILAITTN